MIVAPAAVSATAKRFYILWGLLPLFTFTVWLVALLVVAVSAVEFSNVWVVMALCWIAASWPLSLIWYRRRNRPKLTIPYSSASLSSHQRQASFIVFPIIAAALTILGWYNLKHPIHFTTDMQAHWPPGKEARVPLIKHENSIYVKIWLNDKEELCQVDTGAAAVEWPRGLHVGGRLTSLHGQSVDPLGGSIDTQTVVIRDLRIGGYEVTNLPTEMSEVSSYLFLPPQWPDADKGSNLGNPAFVQTVLTIDYKNAVMVIRPPQYDFTGHSRATGDRVLQMGWTTDYPDKDWESNLYGFPAIRASLAGASFWCTLDTGWAGPELGLTDEFVKHHPSVGQAKHDLFQFGAMHGSAQVERLHGLNVAIPCLWPPRTAPISLRMDGLVTPTLYGGEGVIGLALMERYRITIDYGRRRVLLEPYAQDGPGHKQEKPLSRAKQ